jgi:hypothetical protein
MYRSASAFTENEYWGGKFLRYTLESSDNSAENLWRKIGQSIKREPLLGVLDRLRLAYELAILLINREEEARRFFKERYERSHMKIYGAYELFQIVVKQLGIDRKLALACFGILKLALVNGIEPAQLVGWIGGMKSFERSGRVYNRVN